MVDKSPRGILFVVGNWESAKRPVELRQLLAKRLNDLGRFVAENANRQDKRDPQRMIFGEECNQAI